MGQGAGLLNERGEGRLSTNPHTHQSHGAVQTGDRERGVTGTGKYVVRTERGFRKGSCEDGLLLTEPSRDEEEGL